MLDERLTLPRAIPINKKICLESLDALESEARELSAKLRDESAEITDHDGIRGQEILNEVQAWQHELQAANAWEQSVKDAAAIRLRRQQTIGV